MRRIRVYVDTSVFGGTADVEFAAASRQFFDRVRAGDFVVMVSPVVVQEIARAPSAVQDVLKELPKSAVVEVPATPDATALAKAYIEAEIIGEGRMADALHVALATVSGADLILSWNFKHIVNYDRIHKYNGVNVLRGYPAIGIYSPLELAHGDENQDV
jgi:predicted nucleic acid-binding protein